MRTIKREKMIWRKISKGLKTKRTAKVTTQIAEIRVKKRIKQLNLCKRFFI